MADRESAVETAELLAAIVQSTDDAISTDPAGVLRSGSANVPHCSAGRLIANRRGVAARLLSRVFPMPRE